MKKTRCYIYARVSTAIQVDGYSLDAQKDKLRKYAEFQDMEIVGEYSDEGHSGKNIKGRQEFMRMLNDIEDGKDGVDFVLVFKLSRPAIVCTLIFSRSISATAAIIDISSSPASFELSIPSSTQTKFTP